MEFREKESLSLLLEKILIKGKSTYLSVTDNLSLWTAKEGYSKMEPISESFQALVTQEIKEP